MHYLPKTRTILFSVEKMRICIFCWENSFFASHGKREPLKRKISGLILTTKIFTSTYLRVMPFKKDGNVFSVGYECDFHIFGILYKVMYVSKSDFSLSNTKSPFKADNSSFKEDFITFINLLYILIS